MTPDAAHEPCTTARCRARDSASCLCGHGGVVLGVVQLAAPKGTLPHRTLGWVWVLLMAFVAASAFWIHQIRLWGPWSPIHLLSIFTLVMLPLGVWRARRHKVDAHRWTMTSIFVGALVIAGAFTLVPGRIMHAVIFG
jgi:uncharacterized membrane protein